MPRALTLVIALALACCVWSQEREGAEPRGPSAGEEPPSVPAKPPPQDQSPVGTPQAEAKAGTDEARKAKLTLRAQKDAEVDRGRADARKNADKTVSDAIKQATECTERVQHPDVLTTSKQIRENVIMAKQALDGLDGDVLKTSSQELRGHVDKLRKDIAALERQQGLGDQAESSENKVGPVRGVVLSVSARSDWAATGVAAKKGGQVKIVARGVWDLGSRSVADGKELQVRIGKTGTVLDVGDSLTGITLAALDEEGEVFLRCGEEIRYDNSGEYLVRLSGDLIKVR